MTGNPDQTDTVGRRTILRTGAAGTGALIAGSTPTTAQGDEIDYGGWFDDVDNFEGTVDKRGESEVTVMVGAQGNGGPYAFDPPAIHVDPGTTVIWEWTGDGSHDVATDNAFSSELTNEAGYTFEHTFENPGITKYYCTPHMPMGMKGAVAVGDVSQASGGGGGLAQWLAIGGGLGLAAGLFGLLGFAVHEANSRADSR